TREPGSLDDPAGRRRSRRGTRPVARRAAPDAVEAVVASAVQPLIARGANVFALVNGRVDLVPGGGRCDGLGSTTAGVMKPYCRLIEPAAVDEKAIAECLQTGRSGAGAFACQPLTCRPSARPRPVAWLLRQASAHWVVLHVTGDSLQLLLVPHSVVE